MNYSVDNIGDSSGKTATRKTATRKTTTRKAANTVTRSKTALKTPTKKGRTTRTKRNDQRILNRFKNMVDELMDLFQDCKNNCINKFPNDENYKEQIRDFIAKKPMIEWKRSCEGYIQQCRKLTLKDEKVKEFMLKYQDCGVYSELLNIYNNHVVRVFAK